jgi:hypothetical protein
VCAPCSHCQERISIVHIRHLAHTHARTRICNLLKDVHLETRRLINATYTHTCSLYTCIQPEIHTRTSCCTYCTMRTCRDAYVRTAAVMRAACVHASVRTRNTVLQCSRTYAWLSGFTEDIISMHPLQNHRTRAAASTVHMDHGFAKDAIFQPLTRQYARACSRMQYRGSTGS